MNGHDRLVPAITQLVDATFRTVAIPLAASVRVPVAPDPIIVIVSSVMAMLKVLTWFTNVIAVPTGNAIAVFAGSVNVRALLSAEGCSRCLFASAARMP